jgi:hypothetical protein
MKSSADTLPVQKCAEAEIPKFKFLKQFMLRIQVRNWLDKMFQRRPAIIVGYPRCQNPYMTPRYMMFCTRIKRDAPHTFEFEETPYDQKVLGDLTNSHPSIGILLTGAQFVTVPDPGRHILLPGEKR